MTDWWGQLANEGIRTDMLFSQDVRSRTSNFVTKWTKVSFNEGLPSEEGELLVLPIHMRISIYDICMCSMHFMDFAGRFGMYFTYMQCCVLQYVVHEAADCSRELLYERTSTSSFVSDGLVKQQEVGMRRS